MAKDFYIKASSGGGGGGVPTTRTITINGTTQDLSADRTWTVGDMLTSTYDTDVDGVVDSAERIQIVVRNSTGSTLSKGQVVYLNGATGNRPNALLAKADSEATSSKTIGIVIDDIPNNTDGQIAVNGTLHNLNTSSFTAGDQLWLSATTAGGFVNTPPAEPNHTVFIGYVARVHPTQGRIVLNIQNGYELDELHGVKITSVADNDLLQYDSVTDLWKNESLSSAGIEPTITAGTTSQYWRGDKTWQTLDKSYTLAGNINGGTVALGVTTYVGFGINTTNTIETQRRSVVAAGIVSGVYLRTNASMTGTLVVTVMKNGVAQSMTFTIATGSAAGLYSSTSNTFSVVDGDEVSIRLAQSTATSSTLYGFGLLIK